MRALAIISALLVAPCAAVVTPSRVIVPDFTQYLATTLTDRGVRTFFILPGPLGSVAHQLKVNFTALSAEPAVHVVHVRNHTDFNLKLREHIHQRIHALMTAGTKSSASTGGADFHSGRQTAALLLPSIDGRMSFHQTRLLLAMARKMKRQFPLRMYYNLNNTTSDYIVTFNSLDEPISAAFQSSTLHRDAFNHIYQHKLWSNEGGGSGHGSSLTSTAILRNALPDIIKRYKITSMLDSSCGSMHWMPLVLQDVEKVQPGFKFMGTDVVCSLIDSHKSNFASHSNWQFDCLDYTHQQLPSGYDLVVSRDSLQHLPLNGVWMYLNNVRSSGAKYLLVGSYIKYGPGNPNHDVPAGGYYQVDLLRPPFSVQTPISVLDERLSEGKHMLLFDVQKMTWHDSLAGLL